MDLNDLIDGQAIQRSSVVFLIVATLAMVADGYDISTMGFTTPELVKQWHVSPHALVPVMSAGVFGLLFGAPLLAYVGDRFGRKKAIILTLAAVSVFTLVSMSATTLQQFVVLRFLTGLGLGGLIPNVIALAAEAAPRRRRGMFVIIVNFGVPAGIALPGFVAALLVPHFGWPVLFLVGGLLSLAVGVGVLLFLQESIRYLVQRGDDDAVRRVAHALRPDIRLDPYTRFTVPTQDPVVRHGGSPAKLFAGGLAVVTPVLWIVLAANQFTNFFTVSWLPTLLQSTGAGTAQASVNASMFSIGGLLGGAVLLFVIDRFGVVSIVALFALGAPIMAAIGMVHESPTVLGAIIAGAGFCVTGNNFGLNAVCGMIYPTAVRSKGAGWAQALGRVGALGAQVAGGALLARHLPLADVFIAPAFALVVGAVGAGSLAVLCARKFGGYRLSEVSLSAPMIGDATTDGRIPPRPKQVPV